MATRYLDSTASQGGSPSSPYTSKTTAASSWSQINGVIAAGDIIIMHKAHRETVSSGDITIATGLSGRGAILVRQDLSTDAYDTSDATINFEVLSGGDDIIITNAIHVYGARFAAIDQVRVGGDADGTQEFTDCHFKVGPADALVIDFGVNKFTNCTFLTHSSSNNSTELFFLDDGAHTRFVGGQTSTGCEYRDRVLDGDAIQFSSAEFVGFDMSNMTRSPTYLMDAAPINLTYIDCDLPPNYTVLTTNDSHRCIDLVRCTGSDELERHCHNGSAVNEPTIVRTGGATNSLECITNSYCGYANAFFTPWFYGIADAAESKNFDIHFAYSGTRLTDEEIFIELEFMDSATAPFGTMVTSQKRAILGDTVGNPTTASETWGGSETYEEYLRITQTVGVANSMVRARIGIEKTSQTDEIYVDPYLEIS